MQLEIYIDNHQLKWDEMMNRYLMFNSLPKMQHESTWDITAKSEDWKLENEEQHSADGLASLALFACPAPKPCLWPLWLTAPGRQPPGAQAQHTGVETPSRRWGLLASCWLGPRWRGRSTSTSRGPTRRSEDEVRRGTTERNNGSERRRQRLADLAREMEIGTKVGRERPSWLDVRTSGRVGLGLLRSEFPGQLREKN